MEQGVDTYSATDLRKDLDIVLRSMGSGGNPIAVRHRDKFVCAIVSYQSGQREELIRNMSAQPELITPTDWSRILLHIAKEVETGNIGTTEQIVALLTEHAKIFWDFKSIQK